MSNQQGQQQQQQREREQRGRRQNLNLDFSMPYRVVYNTQRRDTRPVQSGFVSSTSHTYSDSEAYRAQTATPTNGPVQDSKVTNSRDERTKYLLRRFLE